MSRAIEYCGVVYDEHVNWREFIAHPPYRGLEKALDIQSALGALAEALRGTPMAEGLADAALEVIERGDPAEMERVRATGWENAPDAFERIQRIVDSRSELVPETWLVTFFGAMLRLRPNDGGLLELLEKEVKRTEAPPELLSLAARYNPRWLATHLSTLAPRPNAPMARWLWVAPDDSRILLLNSIASLGSAHIASLIAQVGALPAPSKDALLPLLQVHPEFRHMSTSTPSDGGP